MAPTDLADLVVLQMITTSGLIRKTPHKPSSPATATEG